MKEKWKNIIGYEGLYKISSFGRVKSLKRKIRCKSGFRVKQESILKPCFSRGYGAVRLKCGKKDKTFLIHRLVALAFISNTKNKLCVNHIDGNKQNNNVENLEWCTYSENEKHSYDVLNKKPNKTNLGRFEGSSYSSKTVDQLSLSGEFIKRWDSRRMACKALGIQESNVSYVISGKRHQAGGFIWQK